MITQFIKKVCVQTAVYWGDPTPDGYGSYTYGVVKEIKCRWEYLNEAITNKYGKEVMSRSKVLVTEELSDEGYLYLGTLNDLDSNQLTNPILLTKAFPIQMYSKIPLIKSTSSFVHTIFL